MSCALILYLLNSFVESVKGLMVFIGLIIKLPFSWISPVIMNEIGVKGRTALTVAMVESRSYLNDGNTWSAALFMWGCSV